MWAVPRTLPVGSQSSSVGRSAPIAGVSEKCPVSRRGQEGRVAFVLEGQAGSGLEESVGLLGHRGCKRVMWGNAPNPALLVAEVPLRWPVSGLCCRGERWGHTRGIQERANTRPICVHTYTVVSEPRLHGQTDCRRFFVGHAYLTGPMGGGECGRKASPHPCPQGASSQGGTQRASCGEVASRASWTSWKTTRSPFPAWGSFPALPPPDSSPSHLPREVGPGKLLQSWSRSQSKSLRVRLRVRLGVKVSTYRSPAA